MPLGIMSDRLGRKRLVLAGLLISAVSSFLLAFSRTSPQMMVIYVFAGIGLAAFGPTMMSFVADFSPLTHLGRSYGWYTMAIYGGMSLGPAIGGFFAQSARLQMGFHDLGDPGLYCVLDRSCFSFRSQGRPIRTDRRKRDSRKIIRELLGNRPLLACWLVTLFSCFGLGVFITFLPLHASDQGIGVGKIGLIFGTQAIVNALGRIPFGYLSDRVSRQEQPGARGAARLFGFHCRDRPFHLACDVSHQRICDGHQHGDCLHGCRSADLRGGSGRLQGVCNGRL